MCNPSLIFPGAEMHIYQIGMQEKVHPCGVMRKTFDDPIFEIMWANKATICRSLQLHIPFATVSRHENSTVFFIHD